MKKRILLITLAVTFLGLALFALFSTLIYHNDLVELNRENLSVYMLGYENNRGRFAAHDDAAAAELSYECGGARVTFIALDGTVTGDSEAHELGNHADREEVREALDGGIGWAVRNSDTLGEELLYYCKKYDDTLVRLAVTSSTVWSVLWHQLPLLGAFLILDAAACIWLSFLAVRSVLQPVEAFGTKAASTDAFVEAPYPELDNVADSIDRMKRDLKKQLEEANGERVMEHVILDNMQSGMAIFGAEQKVILINKAAAELLGYDKNSGVILKSLSDPALFSLINEHDPATLRREYNGRTYDYRITPVDEIEGAAVLLISDVTAAAEAERAKNDFIGNVTHEMNTPLTAISGFSELIAAGGVKPDKIREYAGIIFNASGRLSGLVKSILNYSAIVSDDLEGYPVDVAAFAAEAVNMETVNAEKRGISVRMDVKAPLTVTTRSERMRELVTNLVSNAVKYNKDGGTVTVTVDGDNRRLIVADTGIGIPADQTKRIFDRFYTVDTSRSTGGYGLGLAIVKRLAAVEGWKITVESEVGVGSTFTVEF